MKNYYISILRRGELAYIRTELELFGLIPLEGRLICLLKDRCCSQEELGDSLDIDKGRIARTIYMLEEKGLVQREVNGQNRRQKLVSLTEKGNEVFVSICGIYEAWNEICYRGFTEEEKQISRDFLRRISENVLEYKKETGGRMNG